ncbi:replication initiation protein [Geobacter sp. FeAm09]|uniref:replication initiation protein n=1 Tax=Geobacter sp. FeAm09 TaxID=2597769 RepID=UPI0011EEA7EB|nr:replication initiation protein [Geobacter sp. FeAm09]QEM67459.1 replication initiation protein [Geobacter sp. FeAm09]
MGIYLKRTAPDPDFDRFMACFLHPEGAAAKPNRVIAVEGVTGHPDPLTEVQQKIITAAISLMHATGDADPRQTSYAMEIGSFMEACAADREAPYASAADEIEKILKKGVWLVDKSRKSLTRTAWFQSIEYAGGKIVFQFADKILPLVLRFVPGAADGNLVKGIQYKGRHTLAVFNVIWPWRGKGVTEYSISHLMQQLALEHTRYSYGQLKLRVLEPSFEEIYAWDDAIFIRFGPTFSGRRVESVWFEVTAGDEARQLREKEPAFKMALPEERPAPPP